MCVAESDPARDATRRAEMVQCALDTIRNMRPDDRDILEAHLSGDSNAVIARDFNFKELRNVALRIANILKAFDSITEEKEVRMQILVEALKAFDTE